MKLINKKGFTLVELLFVMAIISILAGFAIANLNDSTLVAEEASNKSMLRSNIPVVNGVHNKLSELGYGYGGGGDSFSCTGPKYISLHADAQLASNGLCTFTVGGEKIKIAVNKHGILYFDINPVGFIIQTLPGSAVGKEAVNYKRFIYYSNQHGAIEVVQK